jgi:hypothetical protein
MAPPLQTMPKTTKSANPLPGACYGTISIAIGSSVIRVWVQGGCCCGDRGDCH